MLRFRALAVLAVFCAPLVQLLAQAPGTGLYTLGSFDSRGLDSINIGNLNIHFEIPIVSKPGRGLPFQYNLVYDGLIWSASGASGAQYWTPDPNWGFHGQVNGQVNDGFTGHVTYNSRQVKCFPPDGNGTNWYWTTRTDRYVYYDGFGQQHAFNYSTDDCQGTTTGDGSTSDGSGYQWDGVLVSTRYGSKINVPVNNDGDTSAVTDANGNHIDNNGNGTFTDTLGTTALTLTGSGSASSPRVFTYNVANQANGSTQASITVSYRTYTVQTSFGCVDPSGTAIAEYGPMSVDLVDRITLPGSAGFYQFSYESTPGASGPVTGRLASVTLPAGGTISYTYSGGCNGNGINADGTPGSMNRITTDGTRQYLRASSVNGSMTTLQDEATNQSIYTFTNVSGMFYETHRQVFQGTATGTPLLDQQTCINHNVPCDGGLFTLPASTITSLVSKNGGAQQETVTTFDPTTNLVSTVQTYDFTGVLLQTAYTNYTANARVSESGVKDGAGNLVSKVTFGYDEQPVTATSNIPQHTTGINFGNLTSTHAWINTSNSTLDTSTTYYDTGVPVSTSGPTNGSTTYTYDSTQGFATQITPPVPLPNYASYDINSGIQLSSSDANFPTSAQIQYSQYDALLRPTIIQTIDGGKTQISYTDPNHIGTWAYQTSTTHSDDEVELDSYGRLSRRALYNRQSTNGWYQVDYCYNATGTLQFQSTPYQGQGFATTKQCSGNGTTYTYDALGRILTATTPDGTVSYTYNARATKVQDQNGITKITQVDALGRTSAVCEISSNYLQGDSPQDCGLDISGYTGYLTSYAYDQANYKTTITQGVQQRVFQTDSLGRVVNITEPESGETTYSYDYVWVNPNSFSLQVTRKRPRANQSDPNVRTTTLTQFDQIGRETAVYYDDGVTSNKAYVYDEPTHWGTVSLGASKGHLTYAEGYGKATQFAYDPMGRITNTIQCLPGFCGNPYLDVWRFYQYDLAGELTQASYMTQGAGGTRKDTNYAYNQAGQLTSVTDNTSGNILYNATLGPFGLGTWSFGNGLTGYRDYDWAGRTFNIRVCASAPSINCSPQRYGVNAYRSSGRIYASDDLVIGATTYYGYDDFNRQTSTNINYWNSGSRNFTYVYDRYGNRWQQNAPQGGPSPQFTFDKTSNRIAGFAYDAAGDMTNDGTHSYTYDAEGRVLQVDGGSTATYTYDALDNRVQTVANGVTTNYAYNLNGQRAASYDASGNPISNQVYAGGTPIAFYQGGQLHYQHQDWLGTERVRTDANGNVEGAYASLPFGDSYSASGTDNDAYHFAQLDRDSETDTQHAQFRQYSSTQGRWLSPDPYSGSYDPANPQSFNRYTYALNSPLAGVDPTGLDCQLGDGTMVSTSDVPDYEQGICSYLGGVYSPINPYAVQWVPETDITVTAPQPADPLSIPSPVLLPNPSQNSDSGGAGVAFATAAPNNPCDMSTGQRAYMFGSGLLNLASAGVKIVAAGSVEIGSGGVGTALALYGAYSAGGNITTGLIQTVGAFMPSAGLWKQAASVSSSAGSISGLATLVATNGNVSAAASASRWEGFAQFGLKGGIGNPPNPATLRGGISTASAVNSGYSQATAGGKSGCHF